MPDDLEILFPEVNVGGFVVKPWSWQQFVQLAPLIAEAVEKLKQSEFDFERFDPQQLARLLPDLGDIVPRIIGLTVGCDAEKIEALPFGVVGRLAFTIFSQNAEQIRNFTADLAGLIPK